MADRKHFPSRIEARQKSAAERQTKYDALTTEEKLKQAVGKKERARLTKKLESESAASNKKAPPDPHRA